jgi:hypothetical protein
VRTAFTFITGGLAIDKGALLISLLVVLLGGTLSIFLLTWR